MVCQQSKRTMIQVPSARNIVSMIRATIRAHFCSSRRAFEADTSLSASFPTQALVMRERGVESARAGSMIR